MLHQQAIALWRALRNDEQVIYHALTIKAYDVAVAHILDGSEMLLQQGRNETLARWLDALPPDVQENNVPLLLLRTTLDLRQGLSASASALLDRVERHRGIGTQSCNGQKRRESAAAFLFILKSTRPEIVSDI